MNDDSVKVWKQENKSKIVEREMPLGQREVIILGTKIAKNVNPSPAIRMIFHEVQRQNDSYRSDFIN